MAESIIRPPWQAATLEKIYLVHTAKYVDDVKRFARTGGGFFDQDTVVSEQSYEVARFAAGAVCDAVARIDRNEDSTAFCLVRPPGHHAMIDHAMGFCLFNNVAIGARVATRELGYQRVLIIDWDVHHGNGTQAIFWEDAQVAYFSMHRAPFYPFTGTIEETGAGDGAGTTKNLPVHFGTSRGEQLRQFEQELVEFADRIKPQLVFISAGFDAHKDDPIGSLGLRSKDFEKMTRIVKEIAQTHADGKVISVLEGGYNANALAECIEYHLAVLANDGFV